MMPMRSVSFARRPAALRIERSRWLRAATRRVESAREKRIVECGDQTPHGKEICSSGSVGGPAVRPGPTRKTRLSWALKLLPSLRSVVLCSSVILHYVFHEPYSWPSSQMTLHEINPIFYPQVFSRQSNMNSVPIFGMVLGSRTENYRKGTITYRMPERRVPSDCNVRRPCNLYACQPTLVREDASDLIRGVAGFNICRENPKDSSCAICSLKALSSARAIEI